MGDLLVTTDTVCLDKHPSDPNAKVVACTSDAAAYQLAAKGTPISQEDADRLKIKTEKADLAGYTLKIDSHTIARTPEEKAFALTQPQSGLVMAQAEQIRSGAALSVASLTRNLSVDQAAATENAKAEDDKATAKLTAKPAAKRAAKATKTSARKTTKKADKKPETTTAAPGA